MKNKVLILLVSSFCGFTAHAAPPAPLSLLFAGEKLSFASGVSQKSQGGQELFISNPHLEGADQFFPLASDKETAVAVCVLAGNYKFVTFTSSAGQISPQDVLAYSSAKLVTAAVKLKLDPEQYHATPVIDTVLCHR